MDDDLFTLVFQIPHTEPKTPIISHMQHSVQQMVDGGEIPEDIQKINLLNNHIWVKSEFAKISIKIIEDCYSKYGKLLDDGNYRVNPLEFFPAWREIDSLLFELGSILDFFAREINTAYDLGLSANRVDFGKVVTKCNKVIPDELITKKLNECVNTDWYAYFREMRNRITHRLPFVLRGMNDQIFFPDFPEKDEIQPSIKMQIDVLETCKIWLHNILSFVDLATFLIYSRFAIVNSYRKDTGEVADLFDYFKKDHGVDLREYMEIKKEF